MYRPVIKAVRKNVHIPDAEDYEFTLNSSKNQFKIHKKGKGTFEFEARGVGSTYQKLYVDIEHNLDLQPFFIAQFKGASGEWQVHPVINTGSTGSTKWCTGIARLDENTIRLYCYVYDPTLPAYSAFDVDYEYLISIDPNEDAWS